MVSYLFWGHIDQLLLWPALVAHEMGFFAGCHLRGSQFRSHAYSRDNRSHDSAGA